MSKRLEINSKAGHMGLSSLIGKNARDLFPELVSKGQQKKKNSRLAPPLPPDISWLREGIQEVGTRKHEDSPAALVFIIAEEERILVEKILGEMGYRLDVVLTAAHAIQRLQSFRYELIICSTEAAKRDIHEYICKLPSAIRREIYYVLVGSHLHTLYDLEALTLSVNQVINTNELRYLEKILKKGFSEYEKLFGPLLAVINKSTSLL
jgi:hypothetical protein